MKRTVLATLGGFLLLLGTLGVPARAQETAATNPEIERLKTQLAAQQEQIDQLRRTLDEQKKILDNASQPKPPSLGLVASTTPVVPAGDAAPVLHSGMAAALAPPQLDTDPASPLQLKIGTATITPLGFMDFTSVFRSADGGSGIGTNFGGTPYNNVSTGFRTRVSAPASTRWFTARKCWHIGSLTFWAPSPPTRASPRTATASGCACILWT
jgi:hypothetical protein